MQHPWFTRTDAIRLSAVTFALVGAAFWNVPAASANHTVLIEGTCLGPGAAQRTSVPPGTCGDYDGDGRIGTAEDTDEADRVFGTINAALGNGTGAAAGTGANQNGLVLIVASGIFPEVVNITAANGNVTLEAAPGVEANVDAVLQGDPGSTARQNAPGVVINAPENRYVIVRNIKSRNWTEGFQINGNSHVLLDRVEAENNTNYGIHVMDNADVAITHSFATATGYRVSSAGDFPATNTPNPGDGIDFEGQSKGYVAWTTATGNFGDGISGNVDELENVEFDNNRGGGNDRGGRGRGRGNNDRENDE